MLIFRGKGLISYDFSTNNKKVKEETVKNITKNEYFTSENRRYVEKPAKRRFVVELIAVMPYNLIK